VRGDGRIGPRVLPRSTKTDHAPRCTATTSLRQTRGVCCRRLRVRSLVDTAAWRWRRFLHPCFHRELWPRFRQGIWGAQITEAHKGGIVNHDLALTTSCENLKDGGWDGGSGTEENIKVSDLGNHNVRPESRFRSLDLLNSK
jgi:hypothetical protein